MKRNEIKFVAVLVALLVILCAGGPKVMGAMDSEKFGTSSRRYVAFETGTGNIATTFEASTDVELIALYLHTSAVGGSGDFVVSLDNDRGRDYDINWLTQDMSSITDLVWPTNSARHFVPKDTPLDLLWTNPSSAATWALEVYYERR